MRLLGFAPIFFLGFFLGGSAERITYDGYKVFKTSPLSKEQASALQIVQASSGKFDFWEDPIPGRSAAVMADPDSVETLMGILEGLKVKAAVSVPDVGSFIRENSKPSSKRLGPSPYYALDWDDYYSYDTIVEFIEELAALYDFVNVVTIGQTYEGRDMKAIEITKAGPGAPNYFIDAGIHAREWIAPAVTTFIIRELVENDAAHPQYTENVNFYIIPSANPDGYEHSRNSARLWRKTRSETGSAVGCLGVDPNRNFGFHWGETGVSSDHCSEIYNGDVEFSEIETRNLRDYYRSLTPIPIIGHCIHSAAELWLYPFGYEYDTFAENVEEQIDVADRAVEALFQVHGIPFTVEVGSDLYIHSGTALDWYASEGSRFSYVTELRDQGFSFVLPPEQIIPSGEEMWAAIQVVINHIIEVSKEGK